MTINSINFNVSSSEVLLEVVAFLFPIAYTLSFHFCIEKPAVLVELCLLYFLFSSIFM